MQVRRRLSAILCLSMVSAAAVPQTSTVGPTHDEALFFGDTIAPERSEELL